MLRSCSLCAVLLGFSVGCASIRGDLQGVRDATKIDVPDDVASNDIEPGTPAEARAMLGKPLDADTAVRVAILGNRELRATLREIGIPRGRLVQAWTLPNPTVEAELIPERDSNLLLRAEWDVTRVVLTPFRARAESLDVDAARFRAAGLTLATGSMARAAFYRAQAAGQRVALANQTLDALAASRDAAAAMFTSGNMPELDFANEEAAYQTARADAAEMELASRRAHEALVRVLGLHGPDIAFTIAGALPAVPEKLEAADALESRIIRSSFDLQARRSKLEALGRRAGYVRLEGWIPDVALDFHALQPRDPATGSIPNEPWLLSGGARASVPIFDRNQGTAAALDAEAAAEIERYYGAAIDLRSVARSISADLATAHGEARLYQTLIVPARTRVVEQSMLQYNAMRISILQLLTAKREELRAKLAEIDARAEYWIARASYDAMLAGWTPRIIEAPTNNNSTMRGE